LSIDNHSQLILNRVIGSSRWRAMYVCICNGVTDRQIREAADAGCDSVSEMTMRTGAGASCGSCLGLVAELIDEARARRALALPVLARAA